MLRYLRLFHRGAGLVLLAVALANRHLGEPAAVARRDGSCNWASAGLGGAAVPGDLRAESSPGVLIGFVWEWFREMQASAAAAPAPREVGRLERELSR
jgi:hypothetical protein